MKTFGSIRALALGTAALGIATFAGSLALPAAAAAGVTVGVNIGVPGPGFYGTYRIRTGRCRIPRYAFNHPARCGYPRFIEPVFIGGVWVNEPLYWRTYGGSRYFWHGGRWVRGHGSWDGRIYRGNWRSTWHARGWDRHDGWHDRMQDHRENVRDRVQDRMEDRRDNMRDRMQDRREDMRDRIKDRMEDRQDDKGDRPRDHGR